MKKNTGPQKRSSLFLIELMISIFFFSIASAVCIQLFAKAKLTGDESSASNQAFLQAQSAASVFYAGDGTLKLIPDAYPDAVPGDNAYIIWFDKDWKTCESKDTALYQMTVSVSHSGIPGEDADAFSEAKISVAALKDPSVLCELSPGYHAPVQVQTKGDSAS